jgi:hypothetical protein
MKIETIYRKGNRAINEDCFVINKVDRIFEVIDGATGVGGLSGDIASGNGLSRLEKTIMDMETNDPACYQYPRLKQHDDKTGILIHL